MVKVELIYVPLDKKTVHIMLQLPIGATVADALHQSAIYTLHPETRDMPVGIYSTRASLKQLLRDGDRIEIYRPLLCDPKDNRRKKASGAKTARRDG